MAIGFTAIGNWILFSGFHRFHQLFFEQPRILCDQIDTDGHNSKFLSNWSKILKALIFTWIFIQNFSHVSSLLWNYRGLRWLKQELLSKENLSDADVATVCSYRKLFRKIFFTMTAYVFLASINLIVSNVLLPPPSMPHIFELPGTE